MLPEPVADALATVAAHLTADAEVADALTAWWRGDQEAAIPDDGHGWVEVTLKNAEK